MSEVDVDYRAFICYCRADRAWARWLHRKLERFAVPQELIGKNGPHGRVPGRLSPIFLDQESYAAGDPLPLATENSLTRSHSLICICSPRAVARPWVNEEIRLFKSIDRTHRILPFIIGGEPNNPDHECLPPALRFKIAANGTLTELPDDIPLGGDARPEGDGQSLAILKIAAGLLGVPLDPLRKREERYQRQQKRLWLGVAATMTVLAVFATAATVYAVVNRQKAEQNLTAALKATNVLTSNLAENGALSSGITSRTRKELLIRTEEVLTALSRNKSLEEIRELTAVTQSELSGAYLLAGDPVKSIALAGESISYFGNALGRSPDSKNILLSLVGAHLRLGQAFAFKGDYSAAIRAYDESVSLANSSPVTNPDVAFFAALAQTKKGALLASGGDTNLDGTLGTLRNAEDLLNNLANNPQPETKVIIALARLHTVKGGLYRKFKMNQDSAKEFEDALTKITSVDGSYSSEVEIQSVKQEIETSLGQLLLNMERPLEAEMHFRAAITAITKLAQYDPGEADYQNYSAEARYWLAQSLSRQGKHSDAAIELAQGIDVWTRLIADRKPERLNWTLQRAIMRCAHARELEASGTTPDALRVLEQSLRDFTFSARCDPQRRGWANMHDRCLDDAARLRQQSGTETAAAGETDAHSCPLSN